MVSNTHLKILDAIKNNENDKALQWLYKESLPKVIRIVKKHMGNREDGEDVFQDVVIILFRLVKEGKLKKNTNLDALIYTIAKNNWLRKLQRSKKIDYAEDLTSFNFFQGENEIEYKLHNEERNVYLAKSFALLNEGCQQLITFLYFEHLSLAEAAQKMGFKSTDVAKTMHYKCKKKLLSIIEDNMDLSEALKK